MTSARIALAGILALFIGVIALQWVIRPARFPIGADSVHPAMMSVQLPNDRAEFAGLIEFDNKHDCPMIVDRVRAGLGADRVFPLAYAFCLLTLIFFIASPAAAGLPGQPTAARVTAVLTALAVFATIILDYRENALSDAVLQKACASLPAWHAIVTMRDASFSKWGALGVTLLLLGIASLLTKRTPAWHYSYTAIRALAALSGGVCGIVAWSLQEQRLAQIELSSFGVVVLATLWQVLSALR
jgi:hypothetical protein